MAPKSPVKLRVRDSVASQRHPPELRAQPSIGDLASSPNPKSQVEADADAAVFLYRRKLDAQLRCQSRRYLPFDQCCEWVRMNGWWSTEEEWREWVLQGEDRSPYIPTRPDEYYSRLGKWRGWTFFLSGIEDADDDPSWGADGAGPIITR